MTVTTVGGTPSEPGKEIVKTLVVKPIEVSSGADTDSPGIGAVKVLAVTPPTEERVGGA